VAKLNGTALSGLATGLVKNTTGTGVPSIAVAADVPTVAAGSTGPLSATDPSTTNSRAPSGAASGDLSGSFPSPTVAKLNGTALSGLATGLLKNTTGTGVPSIAVAADLPAVTVPGGLSATGTPSATTFLRGDGTWNTPAGGGALAVPPYPPGFFTLVPFASFAGASTGPVSMGLGEMRLTPLYAGPGGLTIKSLTVQVTTGGSAGAVSRLGVYAAAASGVPGTLIADAGTVAATSVGFQTLSGLNIAVPAGLNWLAHACQGATASVQIVNYVSAGGYESTASSYSATPQMTSITGALPGTFSGTNLAGETVQFRVGT
jgi:hypothetical protein